MKRRVIGVTDKGARVGEDHQRARLTDEQVDLMRDLYEEGLVGYRTLARYFGVSRTTVMSICRYERRNATADAYKTIREGDPVRIPGDDLV